MRRRNDVLILSILIAGLALATWSSSCSKSSTPSSPAPSSPSVPSAAPVAVTDVELGRSVGGNKRVTERAQAFGPNDTIYASVITSGSSSGAVLRARWTYQDGQVVDEAEQSIAPRGETVTEFHIAKPDGWPTGTYKVEIFLDGRPVQTREFQVG